MIETYPKFHFRRGHVVLIREANAALTNPVTDDLLNAALGGFDRLPVKRAPLNLNIGRLSPTQRGRVLTSLALAAFYIERVNDRNDNHNWLETTPASILGHADEQARRAIGGMCAVGALTKIKTATISPGAKHSFEGRQYLPEDWRLIWPACYISNSALLAAFLHQGFAWKPIPDPVVPKAVRFCASRNDRNRIEREPRLPCGTTWRWQHLMPAPLAAPNLAEIKNAQEGR